MWSFIKGLGGSLFGGISWGLVLVVVLACLACCYGGYRHGHNTATAEGDARYSKLEAAQACANRLASDTARRMVDAEIIRRDSLVTELATARATIAAQGRAITNGRISDASRAVVVADGHCTFGAAWMRVWNEALGLRDGDSDGSAAAPGAGGEAGTVQGADAGILQGAVTLASPEDILANHRDNMTQCRDTAARYLKLIKWAEGLPKTTTATEAMP